MYANYFKIASISSDVVRLTEAVLHSYDMHAPLAYPASAAAQCMSTQEHHLLSASILPCSMYRATAACYNATVPPIHTRQICCVHYMFRMPQQLMDAN